MAFEPTSTGYRGPVSSMELEGKAAGAQAAPSSGGGGGGGGGGGIFTVIPTGGYGIQAPTAGPLAQNLQNMASNARWANLQTVRGADPTGRHLEQLAEQAGMARAGRMEDFETEMQSQQTQFGKLRLQALQKLLGLFSGGGQGQFDFNQILSGMRRESALPFEEERRGLQSRIAAGGRQFSSAAQDQLSRLNERQGLAGETAYGRAADVFSRVGMPPRFLAQLMSQTAGG